MSVEVNVKGGAGNQLFQYAYARSLSLSSNKNISLNVSNYINSESDSDFFSRSLFLNGINSALPLEVNKIELSLLMRIRRKMSNNYNVKYDKSKSFEGNWSELKRDGYWQSPLYFNPFFNIIKNEISVKSNFLNTGYFKAKNSIGSNTVCIHLRRGDYLLNSVEKIYGLCSRKYFESSINRLKNLYDANDFLVFTDDVDAAVVLFEGMPGIRFAYDFKLNLWEEFELMRSCCHFIISNSTFSWWAAFLETNTNFNKTCIAPFPWFNDDNHYCNSLYLPNWFRVAK